MNLVIPPPPQPVAPVSTGEDFPVRRIFCIGRNYADHVREMGGEPKDTPPVFFTKPADAIVADGANIPYAQATTDLHYEGELVVALKSGGKDIASQKDALNCIYGYAAGCDLTRRDHQAAARKDGAPWDTAKGFDRSAPVGLIHPAAKIGALNDLTLETRVNGVGCQKASLSSMIWSVSDIIMSLSQQFELKGGDLIFTGTPEGVGALSPGDAVSVTIGERLSLQFSIANR